MNQQDFFLKLLLEAQMVSGPLTKSINNSGLGRIKRILVGGAPFLGGERYLQFGTEFHLRCLKRKRGKWRPYDKAEDKAMVGMVKELYKNRIFLKYLPGATIETLHKKPMAFGIWTMHGTLDLKKHIGRKKIIIDLKSTSETTEEGFIKKAFKLDYPRQGVVYGELDDHRPDDETYIIGCCKKNLGTERKPYYPNFTLDLNNFQNAKRTAQSEAEFLLDFYKNYGLPLQGGVKNDKLDKFLKPIAGGRQDSKQKSRRA